MGLDNGIFVKINDKELFGEKLPRGFEYNKWDLVNERVEMLYWRKCWNIRAVIFDFCREYDLKDIQDNDSQIKIPVTLLPELFNRLSKCYNKKWWAENSDSIWDDSILRNFRAELRRAKRLYKFLKKRNPFAYDIYFYDSY